MKRAVIAATIITLAGAAGATGGSKPPVPTNNATAIAAPVAKGGTGIGVGVGIGKGGKGGSATATGGHGGNARSGATSTSTAAGGAGGAGGTGGAASVGANIDTDVTFTSPETVKIKSVGNAPDVLTTPTAPCRVALGASVGFIGGAFGASGSTLDEGCQLRETSRHLYNLGLRDEAVLVMCADADARRVLGPRCPAETARTETKSAVGSDVYR